MGLFFQCVELCSDSLVLAANMLLQHILLQGFFPMKAIDALTPTGYLVLNTCKRAYWRRQLWHLTQTPNLALSPLSRSSSVSVDCVSYSGGSLIFKQMILNVSLSFSAVFQTGCEVKKLPPCLSKCHFLIMIDFYFAAIKLGSVWFRC